MSSELPNTSSTDGKHLWLGLVGWLDRCCRGFATALSAWQHTAHLFITEPSTPLFTLFSSMMGDETLHEKAIYNNRLKETLGPVLSAHKTHTHSFTLLRTRSHGATTFFKSPGVLYCQDSAPTMLHRLPLTQNKRFSTSLTGAKLRTSYYWTDLLMHHTQNYRPGSFQHPHIYVLCPFENSQSLQNLRISIHCI